MSLKLTRHQIWLWLLVAILSYSSSALADNLKPYFLASQAEGDLAGVVDQTKSALQAQGFTLAGDYSPYADAQVIAVTSDALKQAAGKTENGGFGAVQRVSVTKAGDKIQVAYTNPAYFAAAYRMEGDLAGVTEKLSAALGNQQTFGSEKGLKDSKLRKYHYMFAMPYFDDVDDLGSFDSHAAAVEHIEKRLAAGVAGTSKVYRIDIPGKEETLFGVGLTEGPGGDKNVMSNTDTGDLKHTAHLPYEILVTGNKAIALPGKFRIAISFPDLGMGTFMKISDAPGAIAKTLSTVVGNE